MIRLYNTTKHLINIGGTNLGILEYAEFSTTDVLNKLIDVYPVLQELLDKGDLKAYDEEKDKAAIERIENFKAAVLEHGANNDTIYADDEFGQYAALLRRQRMRYDTIKENTEKTERAHAERIAMNDLVKRGL